MCTIIIQLIEKQNFLNEVDLPENTTLCGVLRPTQRLHNIYQVKQQLKNPSNFTGRKLIYLKTKEKIGRDNKPEDNMVSSVPRYLFHIFAWILCA